MNSVFFAPFLDSSDQDPTEVSYNNFIETFLLYQRLFNYSGTVQEILELPYSIYNDIIIKEIKLKKKEKEDLANLKNQQQNKSNNNQFRRRQLNL